MNAPVPSQINKEALPVIINPNTNELKPNNPVLQTITVQAGPGRYIYSVFHTIMSLVAIYLSFRCNNGFDLGSFLLACCCPYLYIIYILATRGTCGLIQGEQIQILNK